MNKVDWKSKLTSRKFWVAVVGFVTCILVALKVPDLEIEQVTAIITGGATLIAYIIGEGLVDVSKASVAQAELVTIATSEMEESPNAGE